MQAIRQAHRRIQLTCSHLCYVSLLTFRYINPSRYENDSRVETDGQHHRDKLDERDSHVGHEQHDSPATPPPYSQDAEHGDYDQHDVYEEESNRLPHQPVINRGYVAESVTMYQRQSQPTNTQHGDYTDEEDSDHDVGQDDTIYTALYDSSDNEEASPMYSQESTINPFEHIPNPEKDWLIAQERERQRIASRHKLGIVGYGSIHLRCFNIFAC